MCIRDSPRSLRRSRGALDPRVHVRLVVVANEQDVLVALGCTRQRLETDVERAAVTGPSHRRGVLAFDLLGRLDPGGNDRCGLEGSVEYRDVKSMRRPRPIDDRPAASGNHGDSIVSDLLQHQPHRQGPAAALTTERPWIHELGLRYHPPHEDTSKSRLILEWDRTGPIGNPFTPTNRAGSGASRFLKSSTISVTCLLYTSPSP